jgi:hypothetical protein
MVGIAWRSVDATMRPTILKKKRFGGCHEPADPLRGKTCERGFDVVPHGGIEDDQPDTQQACGRLYCIPFARRIGIVGIGKEGDGSIRGKISSSICSRFGPCSTPTVVRDVTTRPDETWDEAARDRITPDPENDRDCLGRRLGGKRGRRLSTVAMTVTRRSIRSFTKLLRPS